MCSGVTMRPTKWYITVLFVGVMIRPTFRNKTECNQTLDIDI
jgi:hypothetical protein